MDTKIEFYQTILDLGIKGRMNTPEEFDRIGLPRDLMDWSVLDIGCNIGAFLLECSKRGCSHADGVEVDFVTRLLANGIAHECGRTNVNVAKSLDNLGWRDSYDLVLLLSVTHVVEGITGQEILDSAWRLTKKLLIVEINDRLQTEKLILPEGAILYGKNKDDRSVYQITKNN